jgi:hypothetical protein
MNRGVLSDPSFIVSSKKTSDEKRGNPKKRKGAHQKRPPMKKEVTQKTQRGSSKKTSDEKRGNPKKHKRAQQKRLPMKKEATKKTKRGPSKRSRREKEALAKRKNFQQTYTFIEASSANLTVEGEGDAFRFKSQITSGMKVTN